MRGHAFRYRTPEQHNHTFSVSSANVPETLAILDFGTVPVLRRWSHRRLDCVALNHDLHNSEDSALQKPETIPYPQAIMLQAQ